MTLTLNLGFDRGNARTNVASVARDSNKYIEIDASSMVGEINYDRYCQIVSGTSAKSDDIDENHLVIKYADAYYAFGDFAIAQCENPSTGFADQDRYHGLHTKLAIMAYSLLMAKKLYPKYDAPTDITLNLVMGVPVQAYAAEKSLIAEAFEGQVLRFKVAGRQYSIHIATVKVFMEGAGAAIAEGLDTSGLTAVIDPGSFTTNILMFDGGKAKQDLCRSFPIGVGTAVKRVREKFASKYYYDLTDAQCEEILRASVGLSEPPEIYATNGMVSWAELRDWMLTALTATAEDIQSKINGVWKTSAKQVKKTILVGGGSYYFQKPFVAVYSRVERPKDAEKYNARGYAYVANLLADRSLKKVG